MNEATHNLDERDEPAGDATDDASRHRVLSCAVADDAHGFPPLAFGGGQSQATNRYRMPSMSAAT
jgi:hypothetical protein